MSPRHDAMTACQTSPTPSMTATSWSRPADESAWIAKGSTSRPCRQAKASESKKSTTALGSSALCHATWHPEILKQVVAQGHTVGSHTWSHVDLSKKSMADAQDEIERGISVAIS